MIFNKCCIGGAILSLWIISIILFIFSIIRNSPVVDYFFTPIIFAITLILTKLWMYGILDNYLNCQFPNMVKHFQHNQDKKMVKNKPKMGNKA